MVGFLKNTTMKKIMVILILTSFFYSCREEGSGSMFFKMKYATSEDQDQSSIKSKRGLDGFHHDCGEYITSITPHKFTAKFGMLGFQESYTIPDNSNRMLLFVDGNIPDDDPIRYADFTNNNIVSYSPNGLTNSHGLYDGSQFTFNYFYFDLDYFFQEVNLPEQYESVDIAMFHHVYANYHYIYDSVIVNNVLKIRHWPFTNHLSNETSGYPSAYIFGNCDSTFLFNTEWNSIPGNSVHWPFGGSTINSIIRSNNYTPVRLKTPEAGATKIMIGTVRFDLENLIQIYAGDDNIPYNSDDLFIYAPNFWERITVDVMIE